MAAMIGLILRTAAEIGLIAVVGLLIGAGLLYWLGAEGALRKLVGLS